MGLKGFLKGFLLLFSRIFFLETTPVMLKFNEDFYYENKSTKKYTSSRMFKASAVWCLMGGGLDSPHGCFITSSSFMSLLLAVCICCK